MQASSSQTLVIRKFLCEDILNEKDPTAIDPSDDLLGSGMVDSMGMMRLVAFIEKHFDTKVPPEDLVLENFSTLQAMGDYLDQQGGTSR